MIWGAICHKEVLGLEYAVGAMDAVYYTNILEKDLLLAVNDIFKNVWTLQQDNAPIHNAPHTKNWLDADNINALEWPSVSSNHNIIDNVWEQLVRLVYKDGVI